MNETITSMKTTRSSHQDQHQQHQQHHHQPHRRSKISSFVYVKNDKYGWIPAEIISRDGNEAVVLPLSPSPPPSAAQQRQRQRQRHNDCHQTNNDGLVTKTITTTPSLTHNNDDGNNSIITVSTQSLSTSSSSSGGCSSYIPSSCGSTTTTEVDINPTTSTIMSSTDSFDDSSTTSPTTISSSSQSPDDYKKTIIIDLSKHFDAVVGDDDNDYNNPSADTTTHVSSHSSKTISEINNNNNPLPLQDLDEEGNLILRDDMCDMPFLNEANILYNLKGRYEGYYGDGEMIMQPYTRVGDIILSVNPYRWIHGLYSLETRHVYSDELVWNVGRRRQRRLQRHNKRSFLPPILSQSTNILNNKDDSSNNKKLPPHIYEASSNAYKGLIIDGDNQTIIVSGESGAGKTVAVKILMSHLATFEHMTTQQQECDEKNDEKEDNDGSITVKSRLSLSHLFQPLRHHLSRFLPSPTPQPPSPSSSQKSPPSPSSPPPSPSEESSTLPPQTTASPPIHHLLSSQPLLEAFGNAKTIHNDNSSRFGKFTSLQFTTTSSGGIASSSSSLFPGKVVLAGSHTSTVGFERSRIVHHDVISDERTFHIFYQLLAADVGDRRDIWPEGLIHHHVVTNDDDDDVVDPAAFRYVGDTRTRIIEGMSDGERWEVTKMALLETMKMEKKMFRDLMRGVCLVMQLGNISFLDDQCDTTGRGSVVKNEEWDLLVDLMGVDGVDLERALGMRTITVRRGGGKGEVYHVPLSARVQEEGCRSLAKAIYVALFDWLVQTINNVTDATAGTVTMLKDGNESTTIRESQQQQRQLGVIGLLDIFGFETLPVNQFEQLCINYANELLQRKFTDDVFDAVQREYESEGFVPSSRLSNSHDYTTDTLALFEGRMGIFNLLNEECLLSKGSPEGFVRKLYANNAFIASSSLPPTTHHSKHTTTLLRKKRYNHRQFGIQHYAKTVIYDADTFIKKNVDTLPSDLLDIAISSSAKNQIVRRQLLLQKTIATMTSAPSFRSHHSSSSSSSSSSTPLSRTICHTFKTQLRHLITTTISKTKTRYVKCINPNKTTKNNHTGHMNLKYVLEQLRCSGVIAAIGSSRDLFPNKLRYGMCWNRFGVLGGERRMGSGCCDDEMKERVLSLLDRLLEPKYVSSSSSSSLLPPIVKNDDNDKKKGYDYYYFCGKTLVYFRPGVLEYLESERMRYHDHSATKIQSMVRRIWFRREIERRIEMTRECRRIMSQEQQRQSMEKRGWWWGGRRTRGYWGMPSASSFDNLSLVFYRQFVKKPVWVMLGRDCLSKKHY